MSGGGSSGEITPQSNEEEQEYTGSPYISTRGKMTFQPAPPGALELLAAQLTAGYGAPYADNLAYLQNLYRPVRLPATSGYSGGGGYRGGGGNSGSGNSGSGNSGSGNSGRVALGNHVRGQVSDWRGRR